LWTRLKLDLTRSSPTHLNPIVKNKPLIPIFLIVFIDLLGFGVSVLAGLGYPVLVGASRKSFLEKVLGPIPAAERDTATAAAHTLAIASGAAAIRVHNVVEGLRSARIADAIVRRTP